MYKGIGQKHEGTKPVASNRNRYEIIIVASRKNLYEIGLRSKLMLLP